MRAWPVEAPGPLSGHPLRLHNADGIPRPGPGEVLARRRLPHRSARDRRGPAVAHLAAQVALAQGVTVHPYPLDAADRALQDLEAGRFDGAAVLTP